jgi:D-sedoheptulose 7-phosphate isomerase
MLELAPLVAAPAASAARAKAGGTKAIDYLADLARVLLLVPGEAIEQAVAMLLDARARGKRVYVMGNGGSSATASHFVCDLVKTARVAGFDPVRAFALTDNTPLLTAWANDSAYEHSFAEQVGALVDPDDVVIGISASGNSPNIVAGFRAAADAGARTIGLVGFDGGKARDLVDVAIHVASHDYGLVEDTHSALTHAMAASVRHALESDAELAEFANHILADASKGVA